jgi:hypothetical protein
LRRVDESTTAGKSFSQIRTDAAGIPYGGRSNSRGTFLERVGLWRASRRWMAMECKM